MRLNRFLAGAGVASRRKAEDLILDGRVRINGVVVRELVTRVSETDVVTLDDRIVVLPEKTVVYAFHKPVGVTTTMSDPKQANLLSDWIQSIPERVLPVGRLDRDSSGLLLLTNDGALIHALTHPRFEKRKVYEAMLDRRPSPEAMRQFETGVLLDKRLTAPAQASYLRGKGVRIVLHEGRNRQIRRMWEALGYRVVELHRTEMDGIHLGDLPSGEYRKLTQEEMERLKADV